MDNTPKALLIVAAMLIVILLISFGLLILNKTQANKEITMAGEEIYSAKNKAISQLAIGLNSEINLKWKNNGDGSYTKGNTTITIGKTIYTKEAVQEILGVTEVKYNGNWKVMGVEKNKIKLVSSSCIADVTLGYNDIKADGNTELEKAISSYNNALKTLDYYAEYATGIKNARSLTLEDLEADYISNMEEEDKYNNIDKKTYEYSYSNEKQQVICTVDGEYKGNCGNSFISYDKSIDNTDNINNVISLVSDNYWIYDAFLPRSDFYSSKDTWIASKSIEQCWHSYVNFNIRYTDGRNLKSTPLFTSRGKSNTETKGIRAVIYI